MTANPTPYSIPNLHCNYCSSFFIHYWFALMFVLKNKICQTVLCLSVIIHSFKAAKKERKKENQQSKMILFFCAEKKNTIWSVISNLWTKV